MATRLSSGERVARCNNTAHAPMLSKLSDAGLSCPKCCPRTVKEQAQRPGTNLWHTRSLGGPLRA
eukprot:12975821-Alexandrium_andersonii.AAC.1